MRIELCGRLTVELNGAHVEADFPGRQGRLLFAYLVLNRGRPVSRDELMASLWWDRAPSAPDSALSALLSRLRRALGSEWIEGRSELELVLPEGTWIDVDAAEDGIARAEAAIAEGRFKDAWAPASVALNLTDRGLLPGHDAPWLDEARRRLDELALRALESMARVGLGVGGGELASAERAAQRLIEREPYRESGYRHLMEVLDARGDVAEALRVYERLRRLLRDELGTAPAPELQALHERLLHRGDAAQRPPVPPPPLPTALVPGPRMPFVGRAGALEDLEAAWAQAGAGERHLFLIEGDAGIGKTRLSAAFAGRVHDAGGAVLYGRCDEVAIATYQPFVEALAHHASHAPADALLAQLDEQPGELARLLPELKRRFPDAPRPPRGPADSERYRMFEAVDALLEHIAAETPLLLVVEDLHWADRPTLLLLRHIARSDRPCRLMVLGTYRAGELVPAAPLSEALADLRRDQLGERVALAGLDREEVGELVAVLAGQEGPPELVRTLHVETDGNPFFLREVLRHLVETGAVSREEGRWVPAVRVEDMGLPEGIREVISGRTARLPDEVSRVLAFASVIGREFDLELLEAVSGVGGEELLDALERGMRARVVTEVPGGVGRYAFAHALVRQTLYEQLSETRRVRLHGRIAERLESLSADDPDAHLAELAYHYTRAAPGGSGAKAIEYSMRAAKQALRQLAYEDAIVLYQRALDVLEASAERDGGERCVLLLSLGRAQGRAGLAEASRESFAAAADAARRIDAPEALARAALGFAGAYLETGTADPHRIALLEEALAALGDEDTQLRALVLARLALEVQYTRGGPARRDALSAQAVEVASRLGDPAALARALISRRIALAGSADLAARLSLSSEVVRLGGEAQNKEITLWGHTWRATDLLDLGDVRRAYDEFAAYEVLARELRQPTYLWQVPLFAANRAQIDGRFGALDELAEEGTSIGERAQNPNARHYFGILRFVVRREQGRLAEIEDEVRGFADRYHDVIAWQCGVALLHAELGRSTEARAELGRLTRDDCAALPRDTNWVPGMAWLALACARLGERGTADVLYALLEPHAHRNVTTGHPIFCLGSVAHYLGVMADVAGRWDASVAHLERALQFNLALASAPLAAHTRHRLGEALLARGRSEDRGRAVGLLEEAASVASERGMVRLERDLEATGVRERGAKVSPS